ncbi:MAG: cyclopropane-fatty-acyl-phospholipid synthase [Nitrospirae bacterium CG18_big_fil_WC_8_21_14_2_50_70_55]|nr:cyclopropane fatty acyl phospholipid synthase [Deltaproteobacteria bacterium]PIQ05348.1 MAG: cyclopropane-fatty-acyl-phospholipid synthase [Nitrospirae bacterium CG18_big_fil_WC_8_21_14_2_50_70_55]PIU78809.1 MAG: cyclopropane-fatty-acyl-phospholipid synthase [Nitrospirae bacterium CG06_land_8_20_14_3_00_70_43]PIW81809.1 MAG: cyclopropane-fatty-acyl-phospholipid synthase [Nitrospirae bacterium CG_4_8_14_3_um_filter_70_85]PJB96339.1 MAG: cyclopropane-fatty-acyl-phospholipid synthase [Nitrospir
MDVSKRKVVELFALADVQVDGPKPSDIQVHNQKFYRRFLSDGRLGLGESYQDGWWDCERIDELLFKMICAQKIITKHVQTPATIANVVWSKLSPHGAERRSKEIGNFHYDIGNELYEAILDPYFNYTCGYWEGGARSLEEAQIAKMDRICHKLRLKSGMKLLDIGCGWGGFSKFAAERYGAHVTGISISEEQLKRARELCNGLPVELRYLDYRNLDQTFDRITAIGMFEHVGNRYYRTFMEKVFSCLNDDGLFFLHTIGFNTSDFANPWLQKYIFPGCFVPSMKHISEAYEGLFVLEHLENIGYSYAKTLQCWDGNLEAHWEEIRRHNPSVYDDRFLRTWRYYLLSSVAGFRARKIQVWHLVFSKHGVGGGYVFPDPVLLAEGTSQ